MKRSVFFGVLLVLLAGGIAFAIVFNSKYWASDEMEIPLEELAPSDYPDDPAHHSVHYNRYSGRSLELVRKDETHFDFIVRSDDPNVATVTFKDIDVALFIPATPAWIRDDLDLEKITLIEREWNRQQVTFDRRSAHVEVSGGDGFEVQNVTSLELARNCLNAGLWEVLLYTQEGGQKALYYQGWFDFPLGHYKDVFEKQNQTSYWKHWHRLEHWFDPNGTPVNLDGLRTVVRERPGQLFFDPHERVIVAGEQQRKVRRMTATNVRTWQDFYDNAGSITFATFHPPGRYSDSKPWHNEFDRISHPSGAVIRTIRVPGQVRILDEVEITYKRNGNGKEQRFLISGIELDRLPQLATSQYPRGLYMPMGISVPPTTQSYEELKANPPFESPYFSVLLENDNRWVNHHETAIDGVAMHRDQTNPNLVHIYLLSYERHSLIAHYILRIR